MNSLCAQLLHISQMCNEEPPLEICQYWSNLILKKGKVKVILVDYLMYSDVIFVKEGKII